MSRSFASGSNQYLEAIVTPPAVNRALTFMCWYRQQTSVVSGYLFGFAEKGTNTVSKMYVLQGRNTGALRIQDADGATSQTATTAATISTNVWACAIGVCASATDRRIYLNGGNVAQNTTNVAGSMAALNRILVGIGASQINTYINPHNGDIAECLAWDVELNTSEIAALGVGAPALRVRSGRIIVYYPLHGYTTEPNLAKGGVTYNLTNISSTVGSGNPPTFNFLGFAA